MTFGSTYSLERWLDEVDDLALAATAAPAGQEAAYVQAMTILMRLRPAVGGAPGLCPRRERELSGYVDAGACAQAALGLVPERSCVMTSRADAGYHCASVRLDGQGSEATSVGNSFALALVGALALSFVEKGVPVL